MMHDERKRLGLKLPKAAPGQINGAQHQARASSAVEQTSPSPMSPGRGHGTATRAAQESFVEATLKNRRGPTFAKASEYDAASGLPARHPQALRRETHVDAHRRENSVDHPSAGNVPFILKGE